MKSYKIHRWDAILPPNSSNSLPMVYISADQELLNFAQKNNYKFMVEIRGSDSLYDNHEMVGIFDSLLLGPNCHSQIIKDKNWYTISLNSYFYTYPSELGEIVILDLSPAPSLPPTPSSPTPSSVPPQQESYKQYSGEDGETTDQNPGLVGMSTNQIVALFLLLALVLLIIILIFHK